MAWVDLKRGILREFREAARTVRVWSGLSVVFEERAGLHFDGRREPLPRQQRVLQNRRYRARARELDGLPPARPAKRQVVRLDGQVMQFHVACARQSISRSTVRHRLLLGWSMERALATPVRPIRKGA